jgi:hypothetical protein
VQTNDLTVAEKREIKSGKLGRRGRTQLSVLVHMRFSWEFRDNKKVKRVFQHTVTSTIEF